MIVAAIVGAYFTDVFSTGLNEFDKPNVLEAKINGPLTSIVGESISFSGGDSHPSQDIRKYEWDFGDGTSGKEGLSVSKIYDHAGQYTVTLKITNNLGQVNSETHRINIISEPIIPPPINTEEPPYTEQESDESVKPDPEPVTSTENTKELNLHPGWSIETERLNYENSKVVYSIQKYNPRNLEVEYILEGAEPGKKYGYGIQIFHETTSHCIDTFGQFKAKNCKEVTFQNNKRVKTAVNFYNEGSGDRIIVNEHGMGSKTIVFENIKPGDYEMAFKVNKVISSKDQRAVFQTTEHFGDKKTTTSIRIR